MLNEGYFNLLTVLEEKSVKKIRLTNLLKFNVFEYLLIADVKLSNNVQNLIFRPEIGREKCTYLTKEVLLHSVHMVGFNI